MILRCINNNLCDSLTLNKEYYVIEETSDYYVVIDDSQNETTCKKSRFTIVEDNDLSKKCKATINELAYQLDNEFKDIKNFTIRKNSKGEIKEISGKFFNNYFINLQMSLVNSTGSDMLNPSINNA